MTLLSKELVIHLVPVALPNALLGPLFRSQPRFGWLRSDDLDGARIPGTRPDLGPTAAEPA